MCFQSLTKTTGFYQRTRTRLTLPFTTGPSQASRPTLAGQWKRAIIRFPSLNLLTMPCLATFTRPTRFWTEQARSDTPAQLFSRTLARRQTRAICCGTSKARTTLLVTITSWKTLHLLLPFLSQRQGVCRRVLMLQRVLAFVLCRKITFQFSKCTRLWM